MHDEDFCFRRLTVAGRVSRIIVKECDIINHTRVCTLFVVIAIKRESRPTKELRACGMLYNKEQFDIFLRVKQGSVIKAIGCLKVNDHFELERLLEVT